MPPSPPRPMGRHLLLLSLWLASGCAARERTSLVIPPAADIAAAIEAKPLPTPAILTSARAEADYNALIEAWGERVRAAGLRICKWSVAAGAKLGFRCE